VLRGDIIDKAVERRNKQMLCGHIKHKKLRTKYKELNVGIILMKK
jgi:hypothetical protein